MPIRHLASLLLVLAASASCGAPEATKPSGHETATPSTPEPAVEVFKPTKGRQCEDGGETVEEHAAELQRAGIAVAGSRTGMVPGIDVVVQLCGSPTQTANYFLIDAADVEKAEAIGFTDPL